MACTQEKKTIELDARPARPPSPRSRTRHPAWCTLQSRYSSTAVEYSMRLSGSQVRSRSQPKSRIATPTVLCFACIDSSTARANKLLRSWPVY